MATPDELDSDWIHGVFEVLREELVSLAADFGDRVKHEIDQVAAVEAVRPPSAVALLASVAVETGNIAGSLLTAKATDDSHDDEEDQ
ncbi:hypothetical protein SAMN02745121_05689 [Nannocystis exedens]|uniref:Uncharacterized protein n=1 Tax=Nannocystis exedens TaxID=54 RepID=A0A1I2DR95_9BACT|nr:hypothetical protein [Nannocystis exedens]PCC68978.1 hypothetical protein NAEX_02000 [Nannocystis exedens]SFE82823.1 hypothetical protein SAMN02745121_05689 [Nannocystis exedens]